MNGDLHARYAGDAPFYEVWYGKINFGPGRAFWFRYTLLDGAVREAASWAILFVDGRVDGARRATDLEGLSLPPSGEVLFERGHDRLTERGGRGRCGDLAWDLAWEARREGFLYVPRWMERMGLVGGNYDSRLPDLRVRGEIRYGDETFSVEDAPGMLGHIYGRAMSGRAWGWIHCNDFEERSDAVFEALGIELGGTGRFLSPIGWYVLDLGKDRHVFRPPGTLFGSDNEVGAHGWSFRVKAGRKQLEGRVRAPEATALVEYTDTDGSHRWCSNSKLAPLELRFRDGSGEEVRLRSPDASAFEWVTVQRPDRAPLVD